jgi:hypothetical protein
MRPKATPLIGLAVLNLAFSVTACSGSSPPAGTTATVNSPPLSASPGPGTFASKKHPYQLVVPTGWRVDRNSQSAGSDEDEFVPDTSAVLAGDSTRVTVGFGIPEAGQTIEDRVKFGRGQLGPGCDSDPTQDKPTNLGGESGILWSYKCQMEFSLAINTIHEKVGYRLTAHVPATEERRAKEILDLFAKGFTFSS